MAAGDRGEGQMGKAVRFSERHAGFEVHRTRPAVSSQLLIVASTFLVTLLGLGAAGLAYAGPVAVAAGTAAMAWTHRAQPAPWAAIGLGWPGTPARLALTTLASLFAGWGAALVAMTVAVKGLGWAPIDTARYAGIAGNTPMLLGLLAISWTTAAFGEEVLFRGFLQSRLQGLLGARRHAGAVAILAQAVVFGLAHAYQGPSGMLVAGAIGVVFGLIVLRVRSLWPVIIAHGLIDTVSMLALYAGAGR